MYKDFLELLTRIVIDLYFIVPKTVKLIVSLTVKFPNVNNSFPDCRVSRMLTIVSSTVKLTMVF